jgi:putative nucleotidyltransferase with HDIG domain
MQQFRAQSRALRWLVAIVVATGVLVLISISLAPPADVDLVHLLFWIALTLVSAQLPVHLPGGVIAHTTTAPIVAALFDPALPQPFSVCWVALIGTIELRDIRRQIPWYGTLYNRFAYLLAAFAGGILLQVSGPLAANEEPVGLVAQLVWAGLGFTAVNLSLAVLAVSARQGSPISRVFALSVRNIATGFLALVPLGWLMAELATKAGLWSALLFMVPLQLARYSFTKYTETRELFFGSISALSQAIDAKDGFTRGHADRVSRIAGAIARHMGLSETEIERIELAALLHDIGKIGVEDRILMKPARLEPDEKELMQRHAVYGASILEPSVALRPLVPLVLHHHEHFDGSGYPEGLKADAIPLGSRIILVADAYEAMTTDRVYRTAPGHAKAMETLNRFKGMQFDPKVVRVLEHLIQQRGPTSFEAYDLPPIEYETLAELRRRLAREPIARDAHAG